jgi:predicted nucleic acid-binding protein
LKRILVDANVLVSFLTNRNEDQRKKASALLKGAVAREHVLCLHSMTIVEMAYVLTQLYGEEPVEVARDVTDLLAMPGVIPVDEIPWSRVLELWPNVIASLGDAILAAVASEGRYEAVATFDVPLRKKLARRGIESYWSMRRAAKPS